MLKSKKLLIIAAVYLMAGCTTTAVNFVKSCSDGNKNNCVVNSAKEAAYDNEVEVEYWQTYSFAKYKHFWNDKNGELQIVDLGRVAPEYRSVYGYLNNSGINIENRGGPRERFKIVDGNLIKYYVEYGSRRNLFESDEHFFYFDERFIKACKKSRLSCSQIEIMIGSYPYMYSRKKENVIIGTNYGEVLGFINGEWCRMKDEGGVYTCSDNKMLLEGKRLQFYSYIDYDGVSIIGQWPDGLLYEFDGAVMKPMANQPLKGKDSANYEAQAMAMYCGELYVGFWPKGELYSYNPSSKTWSLVKRFFKEDVPEAYNIPFWGRKSDAMPAAFFGQRITSLIPFEDSLYVLTSNLHGDYGEVKSDQISDDIIDSYGKIYRLKKDGCYSEYVPAMLY